MIFEQVIHMPKDRIGVLVGREGNIKTELEKLCSVKVYVNSETGAVNIKVNEDISKSEPFKAVNIVTAISRGFSPKKAFKLLDDNVILEVIDLRDYAGKSKSALTRIRGRIIGLNGNSRRLIEELSKGRLSVYGHTATLIGTVEEVKLAGDAVRMLASGSSHRTVYNKLQKARSEAKLNKLKLWEE